MNHLAMIGMARDIGFCVDEYLCEFTIKLLVCLYLNALCSVLHFVYQCL